MPWSVVWSQDLNQDSLSTPSIETSTFPSAQRAPQWVKDANQYDDLDLPLQGDKAFPGHCSTTWLVNTLKSLWQTWLVGTLLGLSSRGRTASCIPPYFFLAHLSTVPALPRFAQVETQQATTWVPCSTQTTISAAWSLLMPHLAPQSHSPSVVRLA
jgi:hypothetical protein